MTKCKYVKRLSLLVAALFSIAALVPVGTLAADANDIGVPPEDASVLTDAAGSSTVPRTDEFARAGLRAAGATLEEDPDSAPNPIETLVSAETRPRYAVRWNTSETDGMEPAGSYGVAWTSTNPSVINFGTHAGTLVGSTDVVGNMRSPGSLRVAGPGTTTLTATVWGTLSPAPATRSFSWSVTVYAFSLGQYDAQVVQGATGNDARLVVTPVWLPSEPESATVSLRTGGGSLVRSATTSAGTPGIVSFQQNTTNSNGHTYSVNATLANEVTLSDPLSFSVTVVGEESIEIENLAEAPGTPTADDGNVGTGTGGNVVQPMINSTSVISGKDVLKVTYVAGADYAIATEPSNAAAEATISQTGIIYPPKTAGAYSIKATVTLPGGRKTEVSYEVTVRGDVGVAVSENGPIEAILDVPTGVGVALVPSWKQPSAPNYIAAPAADQEVVYRWSLANAGQLSNYKTRPGETVIYRGADNTVTVTAFATWTSGAEGGRGEIQISEPVELIVTVGTCEWPATGSMEFQTQNASPVIGSMNGRLPELPGGAFRPATSGTATTQTVQINDRFELRVPDSVGWGLPEQQILFEWQYRTSGTDATGGDGTAITQSGFYGTRSEWLRSAPVTSDMDGWQYRLVVRSIADANGVAAASPWITVFVEEAEEAQESPIVQIESAPVSSEGTVLAAQSSNVTLKATVINNLEMGALAYRWQSSPAAAADADAQWSDIPGATDNTLAIQNVQPSQSGMMYRCIAANSALSASLSGTSNALTLQVNMAEDAVIITTPTATGLRNFFAGGMAVLAAFGRTANGDPVTYQWYRRALVGPVHSESIINTTVAAAQYLESAAAAADAIAGATRNEYATPDLEAGAYEYFCRVTNARNSAQWMDSSPFYIIVTNQSKNRAIAAPTAGASEPQLEPSARLSSQTGARESRAAVPTDVSISPQTFDTVWPTGSDTVPAVQVIMQSSATSGDGTPLSAVWYLNGTKLNHGDWLWLQPEMTELPTTTPIPNTSPTQYESTVTLTATTENEARKLSGDWMCRWVSSSDPSDTSAPYADSDPCTVNVILPGDPIIRRQPESQTGSVGMDAVFTVDAELSPDPDTIPEGSLVYIWQRSRDGGLTWTNCTAADGKGQFTSTFTVPITQIMYDNWAAADVQGFHSPYTYRVIVANGAYGPSRASRLTTLLILPAAPAITATNSSGLEVTEDPQLGEILVGTNLTASKDGRAAAQLRSLVSMDPESENYALYVLDAEGNVLPDDAIVGTGCQIQLICADGNVIETVTIIVLGDVTGTGKTTISQLVRLAAAFRGGAEQTVLRGPYLMAGQFSGNGSGISLSDIVHESALYRESLAGTQ